MGSREPRHIAQALRAVGPFRAKAKVDPTKAVAVLTAVLSSHVSSASSLRVPLAALLALLPQPVEPVKRPASADEKDDERRSSAKLPETELFISLLVLTVLLDLKRVPEVSLMNLTTLDGEC